MSSFRPAASPRRRSDGTCARCSSSARRSRDRTDPLLADDRPGLVLQDGLWVGVYNCAGALCEGDWDEESCWVVCPRHGAQFDLATGVPRPLPATEPVPIYPVRVVDGTVVVELPDAS